MKKGLLAVSLVFILILISGCSKTIVVEENAKEEQLSKKYEIKERPVINENLDGSFNPGVYNESGVYGDLLSIIGNDLSGNPTLKRVWLLNKNGEFNNTDFEVGKYEISFEGIENKGFHTSDYNFYYRDIIANKDIKLTDYNKVYERFVNEAKGAYMSQSNKLPGNSTYYFEIISDNNEVKDDNLLTNRYTIQQTFLVNINNGETFHSEIMDVTKGGIIKAIYYDTNEEILMAINDLNEIKKVNLKDGKINFSFFKKIDLKEWNLSKYQFASNIGIINNNLILEIADKNYKDIYTGIYNLNTGKFSLMEEGMYIVKVMEENNMAIIYSNKGFYLGEITEDFNVDLIYKIGDSKKYNSINAIVNKEGDSIFIKKQLQESLEDKKEENPFKSMNAEYSFIDIKKIKK